MRVISWNVNSARTRFPRLLSLLQRHEPDLVCLQETKLSNNNRIPTDKLETIGYRVFLYGNGGHNGVAMLVKDPNFKSRHRRFSGSRRNSRSGNGWRPPSKAQRGFPGDPTPHEPRVMSVRLGGVMVVNAYVINGMAVGSEKFRLKQVWMSAFGTWLLNLPEDPPLLVVGDFNVAPGDQDVWNPTRARRRIHCTEDERAWLRSLQGNRLLDLLRSTGHKGKIFTWWPYREDCFGRNEGFRFDLAFGDETVARRVRKIWVDTKEREPSDKLGVPSDHAPVIIDLARP